MEEIKTLHRGRLERAMDELASQYTSSMQADVRIFEAVVQINMAHTIMLAERNIIPERDAAALLRALCDLYEQGIKALELKPELEDIHMAVEKFVTAATSERVGGKLNTAKSRNDQVASAIRMRLRKDLLEVGSLLLELTKGLLELAKKHTSTVMPGYTHLQVAQPTTFAHYLASYTSAFLRDFDRLSQVFELTNSCPMGSGALAGTSFQIDQDKIASLLGFKRVLANTMDAVSSRDFALQAMSALAILMTNLSRLAEELVLWSSAEFNMVEMPEEFAATSSIMPQKKNPVVAEIARAKTGRLIGDLLGALTIMKALPQSYNLDMQDLTPLLWDSVDQVRDSIKVMSKLIEKIKPNPEIMRKRAEDGFAAATELADMLVRKAGLAFREAHSVIGKMVDRAVKEGKAPRALTLKDLQTAGSDVLGKIIQISEEDFKEAWDLDKCIESRVSPGGPAPKAVKAQLDKFKNTVKRYEKFIRTRMEAIAKAEEKLLKDAREKSR